MEVFFIALIGLSVAGLIGGIIYIPHQVRFLYYRKYGNTTTGKVSKIVKYTHSAEIKDDTQVIEELSSSVVGGTDSETADNENRRIFYKSYIEYAIADKTYTRQLDGRANIDDTFPVYYLPSKPLNAIVSKAKKGFNIGLIIGFLICIVIGLSAIAAMFIYASSIVLPLVLLIAGVLFVISGVRRVRELYFWKYGTTTTGKVTKAEVEINSRTDKDKGQKNISYSYSLCVVYTVAGKEYSATSFGIANIGDVFPVYYLPSNPQKAKIYTYDYDIETSFGNLLAGIIGIAVGAVGLFMYFFETNH